MLDLRKGMSGLKGGSEEYNQSLQKLDSALQKGELSETQYAQQLEALNMKYFEAAGVAKARAAAQLAGQTGMSGLLAMLLLIIQQVQQKKWQIFVLIIYKETLRLQRVH